MTAVVSDTRAAGAFRRSLVDTARCNKCSAVDNVSTAAVDIGRVQNPATAEAGTVIRVVAFAAGGRSAICRNRTAVDDVNATCIAGTRYADTGAAVIAVTAVCGDRTAVNDKNSLAIHLDTRTATCLGVGACVISARCGKASLAVDRNYGTVSSNKRASHAALQSVDAVLCQGDRYLSRKLFGGIHKDSV